MVCDWPGNVRQVTNEIQRILARSEDGTLITADHLSSDLGRTAVPLSPPASSHPLSFGSEGFWHNMTLGEAVDHLERLMIGEALRKAQGQCVAGRPRIEYDQTGTATQTWPL
jgi:transcriptional regulator with PAS, ATPase and Fis domain